MPSQAIAPPRRIRFPFLILLAAISGVAMMVPAAVASVMDDDAVARAFFYTSMLVLMVTGLAGIAAQSMAPAARAATHLIGLFMAYILLPALLALPFLDAVGNTRFINAYSEMLSALTTTGATYFDPDRLVPALHLWRAMVGWLGGFLIWVTAIAVLAPMNLGGFEVTSEAQLRGETFAATGEMRAAAPQERMRRTAFRFAPIYAGLTSALWLLLIFAGEGPLTAAIHAMSTLSTSGITPADGLPGGVVAELMIFAFFIFALSRRTFTSGIGRDLFERLPRDRELRLAFFSIVVLTALLFLRHWLGALEVSEIDEPGRALQALWGSLFTVASFLTTTGFISDDWEAAKAWSGLPTPGLLMMGLCLMGGGVATTAGGIKLLRVYALYKHGVREMEKLVHPNSVASAGRLGRRIRREGAYIAWIFFMLFTLSLAATMICLSLSGLSFEDTMILSIAALTTTGSLAQLVPEAPIVYGTLGDGAKLVLGAAMIIGRLETLVLIALVNPAFWRA